MGGSGAAGFVGQAPIVKLGKAPTPTMTEKEKYEKVWREIPNYRVVAPGEHAAGTFLAIAKPKEGATVIDFGAGTGRGALQLALPPPMGGNLKVRMVDFASNCLDDEIRQMLTTQDHVLSFMEHDLTQKFPQDFAAEYGFCTDVMEHIPPHEVDKVLHNVLQTAQHCFFQISCQLDNLGAQIGQQLHLSVHNHAWWLEKFKSLDCMIHWSMDVEGEYCFFYVTAWTPGPDITKAGQLNISEEQCRANVKRNVCDGWAQVSPHLTNDREVVILGGGPSLKDYEDDIRQLQKGGASIVTLNNAYHWAREKGIWPVTQIMVDAREFNKRFTHPVDEKCLYLIASQCDPATLEGLPKDRTYLWHTSAEMFRDILNEHYDQWYGIPGGSTVLLRALPLLRMLGFKRFHLFGCDSCLLDSRHHAYEQKENEGDLAVPVNVGDGKMFMCYAWMVTQGQEFVDLIKVLGDELELEVYGEGLLAHILRYGASLSME